MLTKAISKKKDTKITKITNNFIWSENISSVSMNNDTLINLFFIKNNKCYFDSNNGTQYVDEAMSYHELLRKIKYNKTTQRTNSLCNWCAYRELLWWLHYRQKKSKN